MPAAAARSFGKYNLVAKLAIGGMAEIFLARLTGAAGFEKLVCIKRILPALAKDPQFVSMFLSEAKIAAQISHANVCQVFELGEIDGRYFIAMEYLEGIPLACFRREDLYAQPPDPRLVTGLIVQACEGLHDAHQLKRPDGTPRGLVHRDVSGNNLFATVGGIVKVLDFGIAKAQDASVRTSTGSVKGTYAYMAPEQLKGEPLDRRTDVFALGTVLWEMFGRKHLFRRETDFLTFQAITAEPIPDVCELRPDLPPALGVVIAKALARDRNDRFPTARALGEALATAVAPLGGPLVPSAISEEIERAFEPKLREQRKLIQLAHTCGSLELDEDVGPGVGYGTELLHTPSSIVSASDGKATEILRPSQQLKVPHDARSETKFVPPLPMIPPRRGLVMLIALFAAIAIVAIVVAVYFARSSGSPVAGSGSGTGTKFGAPVPDAPASTVAIAPLDASLDVRAVPVDGTIVAVAPIDAAASAPIDARNATPPDAVAKRPDKRPKLEGPPGFITIDSPTVFAVITIDGKSYGETPVIRAELSPGKHAVRAVSADGAVKTFTITIQPGTVAPARRLQW